MCLELLIFFGQKVGSCRSPFPHKCVPQPMRVLVVCIECDAMGQFEGPDGPYLETLLSMSDFSEVGNDGPKLRAWKGIKKGNVGADLVRLRRKVLLSKVIDSLVELAICSQRQDISRSSLHRCQYLQNYLGFGYGARGAVELQWWRFLGSSGGKQLWTFEVAVGIFV